MIEVNKASNIVTFEKKHWFSEEIEVAESLGFRFQDDRYRADLNCTSNTALYAFMRYCFANFVKSDEYRTERLEVYADLRNAYIGIHSKADKLVRDLPFYDAFYQHQSESVLQMLMVEHNLLAFEQGLGKTVTAIAISEVLQMQSDVPVKTLIVCPAICKWNWYNELLKWGVDASAITVYDSKKKNIRIGLNERYIVINYDMLKKYLKVLTSKNFKHIICDESHAIKNISSNRFKYVSKIVRSCKAKISLLTGTPIWNKVDDLFAYLKLIRHRLGGNYKEFITQYTHHSENRWGGFNIIKGKNLFELSIKISNFMIRKLKDKCLDLPDKVYTKYYFDFLDYSDEYTKCIQEAEERDNSIISSNKSVHSLNIVAAKSKIKNIIELAENVLYNNKKVVIFTSYTEPRQMLERHFGNKCVSIYGGMSSDDRQKAIDKFQNGNTQVFIGNMQAAGIGINLYASSDVIFCNFSQTASELMQCIDRLHRIGQLSTVNVYYTISRGSIDESLYDMCIRKADDSSKTIDGGRETIELENAYSKIIGNAIKKWRKH